MRVPPKAPGWDVALSQMADTVKAPFVSAAAVVTGPEPRPDGMPQPPANPIRKLHTAASAAISLIGMPAELANTGFAFLTAAVPTIPLPAATLGTLYVGPPHGHPHPPSLIPPAPVPIPLPSLGPVALGTSVKVAIGGIPAARCGDIAMAVTCGGFVPAAKIYVGSSKVFIGGQRAARITDITNCCMVDVGGPVRGLAAAMAAANQAIGLAGVVASAVEAGTESDPNLAAAQQLAATMGAAQLAADAAAMALSSMIGSDPAVPPAPGMLVTPLAPHVLIGGFPMIAFPDPAEWLFKKAKNRWSARKQKRQKLDGDSAESCGNCPA